MEEKGLDLEAYKERCILRRVYLKVRSGTHKNLGAYYRVLKRNPEELEILFQYLTIHVTEFFRNPTAFKFLEKRVLPNLLAEHSGHKRFNIWSVGCSSGEEPYSLAILMMKVQKKHGISVPFSILASDVDRKVLKTARKGIYSEAALKDVEVKDVGSFFEPCDDGYQVKEEVKKSVVFKVGNVLNDRPDEHQSLIVCRNLLIYLSRGNQEKVISGFSERLHPGGHLMLGKAETLIGRNRLYFQSVSPAERVYRRRDMPLEESSSENMFKLV